MRLRCAPSPTGHLHLGVARTALFNALLARRESGQFLLRIEDTDRERSRPEFVESILAGLAWLGIVSDEEPLIQSSRQAAHQVLLQQLLDSGQAYRCDCSRERLTALREEQSARKENPHYDGHCRARTDVPTEGSVIRLKTPRTGTFCFDDRVFGPTEYDLADVDDFIIAKSDGSPTYQFAVVADDHHQGVDLVLRGNDLMISTPRQGLLYQALGWPAPEYAHLPMILGKDKAKLSKRHGATALLAYRALGYLPSAVCNYLARLGWSHGDQEVFTPAELATHFSLASVSRSPAIFDPEKLAWLNGEHLRALSVQDLASAWLAHLRQLDADTKYLENSSEQVEPSSLILPQLGFLEDAANQEWVTAFVAACQERSATLVDLSHQAAPFLVTEIELDPAAVKKVLKPEARAPLERILAFVGSNPAFDGVALHDYLQQLTTELDLKLGKVAQPLRVALTGRTFSPPIDVTVDLVLGHLGAACVETRIRQALARIPDQD